MDITWSTVFAERFAWVDLLIFIVVGGVHLLAWLESRWLLSEDTEERSIAATSVRSAAVGGITAVGILVPLTLLAIQMGRTTQGEPLPKSIFLDVFIADLWFATSLALGLWVLWIVAVKANTRNVLNLRQVGIPFGWQLIALVVGVIRLLFGIWTLVESA